MENIEDAIIVTFFVWKKNVFSCILVNLHINNKKDSEIVGSGAKSVTSYVIFCLFCLIAYLLFIFLFSGPTADKK